MLAPTLVFITKKGNLSPKKVIVLKIDQNQSCSPLQYESNCIRIFLIGCLVVSQKARTLRERKSFQLTKPNLKASLSQTDLILLTPGLVS